MHVITHFAMGGAETVAIGLCESLAGQTQNAVFAVIGGPLSPVGAEMLRRLDKAETKVWTGTPGRFKTGGALLAALRLIRAIHTFRPTVLHLHTEIPELTAAIAGVLSAAVRRIPTLRTIHNSTLWIDWGAIGRWVTQRHAQARLVAVSAAAARADAAIRTTTSRSAPDVIYNGVAVPDAKPWPGAAGKGLKRNHAAGQDSRLKVLFAGRLVEQKGADLLPQILKVARSLVLRDDVEITVAGEGPLRPVLLSELSTCAPRWTVRMCPPIAGLADQLSCYDALLMPSRFEGFALLPLEAMVRGVPLVVCRAPGLDEALPDRYPFVAEADDADTLGALLAQVLNEPDATRRLVRRFVAEIEERFGISQMSQRYADIYAEMTHRSEQVRQCV